MKVANVYYQEYNFKQKRNNTQNAHKDTPLNQTGSLVPMILNISVVQNNAPFHRIEKTHNKNEFLAFTGEDYKKTWTQVTAKAKNITEKIVNKTKNSFAHIQSLFQTNIELPEE